MNLPQQRPEQQPELMKAYSELLFETTELRQLVSTHELETTLDRTFIFSPGRPVELPRELDATGLTTNHLTTKITYGTVPTPSPQLSLPQESDLRITLDDGVLLSSVYHRDEDDRWVAQTYPKRIYEQAQQATNHGLKDYFLKFLGERYPDIVLQTSDITRLLFSVALPDQKVDIMALSQAQPRSPRFTKLMQDLLSAQADQEEVGSTYSFQKTPRATLYTSLSSDNEGFSIIYPHPHDEDTQLSAESSVFGTLSVKFRSFHPYETHDEHYSPDTDDLHYLLGVIQKEIRHVHQSQGRVTSTSPFEQAETESDDTFSPTRRPIHYVSHDFVDRMISGLDFEAPPEASELGVSDN